MKQKFILKSFLFALLTIFVAACSSSKIQTKKGSSVKTNTKYSSNKKYSPITKNSSSAKGKSYKNDAIASYYHDKFNGRSTANGEKFNNNKLTAAHKTLAFGTVVKVTNTANNKSVIVVINDRGPFTKGREIDLSKKAFFDISDKTTHGTLNVNIEIID